MFGSHERLPLPRLPLISRTDRNGKSIAPGARFARKCRLWGGSPGNRTLNLRIKSPLLCLVELATPTGIVVAHERSVRGGYLVLRMRAMRAW